MSPSSVTKTAGTSSVLALSGLLRVPRLAWKSGKTKCQEKGKRIVTGGKRAAERSKQPFKQINRVVHNKLKRDRSSRTQRKKSSAEYDVESGKHTSKISVANTLGEQIV
ncbi:hypothetical protein Q1695_008911 [Nippostrongylus brasiliensis]|nr:hypothetical protein Q1695_008911 [Nippostrongylus brasiliensis]